LEAQEWGVVAACPPDGPGQRTLSARLRGGGAVGRREKDHSPLQQPYLVVRYPVRRKAQRHEVRAEATYELELRSRRLVPGRGPAPRLRKAEREVYLASDEPVDHAAPAFREWLKFHREPRESDVEFARRVYSALAESFEYRWEVGSDNRASVVCQRGWGHCGQLANLFAAVLRANGIPARTLVGRWAQSSGPAGDRFRDRDHVKAEFYASDAGWVPVDLSSAIVRRDVPGHFGQDRGDFIVLHYDSVLLDRPRSLQSMQCPRGFGVYQGSWDGWSETREIRVEDL